MSQELDDTIHLDLSFLLPCSSPSASQPAAVAINNHDYICDQTIDMPDTTSMTSAVQAQDEQKENTKTIMANQNSESNIILFQISPTKEENVNKGKRHNNDENQSSLGKWNFNNKKRKRIYISLTGKKLDGAAAITQARIDKMSLLHPTNSIRNEMYHVSGNIQKRYLLSTFNVRFDPISMLMKENRFILYKPYNI